MFEKMKCLNFKISNIYSIKKTGKSNQDIFENYKEDLIACNRLYENINFIKQ